MKRLKQKLNIFKIMMHLSVYILTRVRKRAYFKNKLDLKIIAFRTGNKQSF